MRKNLPVTDKEYQYNEQQRIVSTTSKKAVINHINQAFIDISGFTADELLGQPHNIVRHPEMPPAAFKDM